MPDDRDIATLILFGSFALLLVVRTPISFALAISAVLAALYTGTAIDSVVHQIQVGLSSPMLLAIPFFILAGEIMSAGSISNRLIDLAMALVGRFRGGLASVNILSSMFFGGVSGSSVADTSSIGSVLIPMMKKRGYDSEYAVSVTVASSTQGVIIPPSHNAIIFGFAYGFPQIGALFLAGVLPGILIGLAMLGTAWLIAIQRGYPAEPAVALRRLPGVILRSFPALLTAVIIVGGILSGFFTATESAVIAVVYALLLSMLVYRDVGPRKMGGILLRAVRTTTMVMFLIGAAAGFAWMMTSLQVPLRLSESLLALTDNPTGMLLIIMLILLLLGCVMDMAPLILICAPIFAPAVNDTIGMHPAQFGIVMLLALGIGLVTPPVGSTLFVGCAIGQTTIERVARTLWPFYLTMIAVLLLVAFWPDLTLLLPRRFTEFTDMP